MRRSHLRPRPRRAAQRLRRRQAPRTQAPHPPQPPPARAAAVQQPRPLRPWAWRARACAAARMMSVSTLSHALQALYAPFLPSLRRRCRCRPPRLPPSWACARVGWRQGYAPLCSSALCLSRLGLRTRLGFAPSPSLSPPPSAAAGSSGALATVSFRKSSVASACTAALLRAARGRTRERTSNPDSASARPATRTGVQQSASCSCATWPQQPQPE